MSKKSQKINIQTLEVGETSTLYYGDGVNYISIDITKVNDGTFKIVYDSWEIDDNYELQGWLINNDENNLDEGKFIPIESDKTEYDFDVEIESVPYYIRPVVTEKEKYEVWVNNNSAIFFEFEDSTPFGNRVCDKILTKECADADADGYVYWTNINYNGEFENINTLNIILKNDYKTDKNTYATVSIDKIDEDEKIIKLTFDYSDWTVNEEKLKNQNCRYNIAVPKDYVNTYQFMFYFLHDEEGEDNNVTIASLYNNYRSIQIDSENIFNTKENEETVTLPKNLTEDERKVFYWTGKLPTKMITTSYNMNTRIKYIKYNDGNEEDILLWNGKDSVVEFYKDTTKPYEGSFLNTGITISAYTGDGKYNFIIDTTTLGEADVTNFDYDNYHCGTLLGYISERDSDNKNAPIQDNQEFLVGFCQPGESISTIYGYETIESELIMMKTLYSGHDPGEPDETGKSDVSTTIINYNDGGKDVFEKLEEDDFVLTNDSCTYQTGNQFVTFRLRNPYDGKVLNFDDNSAYGTSTYITVNNGDTEESESTTHEQPYFLTLWEQRSIFDAINNKPTFVNECNSYNQLFLSELQKLNSEADTNPILSPEGYINKNNLENFSDTSSIICLNRINRKSSRAIVDNIDDWFNWFKREEKPGIIANSSIINEPGGSPLMFCGPLLNDDYGCCIQSDAVQASKTLGPGESITVPIVVLYKVYEESGRDNVKYTIGFDIRNSLYLDPLYYQFTLNAKYSSSVVDAISSQKASIQSSTRYNVTVR